MPIRKVKGSPGLGSGMRAMGWPAQDLQRLRGRLPAGLPEVLRISPDGVEDARPGHRRRPSLQARGVGLHQGAASRTHVPLVLSRCGSCLLRAGEDAAQRAAPDSGRDDQQSSQADREGRRNRGRPDRRAPSTTRATMGYGGHRSRVLEQSGRPPIFTEAGRRSPGCPARSASRRRGRHHVDERGSARSAGPSHRWPTGRLPRPARFPC